jgi:hypothetical protein
MVIQKYFWLFPDATFAYSRINLPARYSTTSEYKNIQILRLVAAKSNTSTGVYARLSRLMRNFNKIPVAATRTACIT